MIPVQPRLSRNRPAANLPHPSSELFRASTNFQKTHFVRDVPQNMKAEDVKAQNLKVEDVKSFRARLSRLLPNLKVEDVKNQAFVRDIRQFAKAEVVKMTPDLSVPLRG